MEFSKKKHYVISALLLCNLIVSITATAQERLIFAIDLIRHGDRAPLIDIAKSPFQWREKLGQLTATGMQQEYILGSHLREIYVNQYHLLPANYTAGTLYVRSSDIDRTLMSAQSFLFGLYPLGTGPSLPNSKEPALPHNFQPIPIHTIAKAQEDLLVAWTESPKFKDYLKKYVYPTPEWQQKTAVLQPKYAKWSQATGVEIHEIFQLKTLGDALYINQLYKIPLPGDLTPQDAQEIIDTSRWIMVTAFKPSVMGKNTGNALLKLIANYLQEAATQKTSLKYVLLSSHDTSQLSLLSAMAAPANEAPPYASDLNFSLFENAKQEYYLKVTFNGKDVIIPNCNHSGTCSLKEFSALAQ